MAKMSLKEWINSNQKAKGLSTKEAKAGASKYKSISAAKKAGSLYYTNKDGKTMIAATAEDLKVTRPKAKPKPLRPRMRPTSGGSTSAATDKETAEVKEANLKIKADRTAEAKRLVLKNRAVVRGRAANKQAADSMKKLKGAAWMKANNFSDYMALSKSEARALELPATRFVASQHNLRNQKFKDGKGFFVSTEKKVGKGPDPSKLAKK